MRDGDKPRGKTLMVIRFSAGSLFGKRKVVFRPGRNLAVGIGDDRHHSIHNGGEFCSKKGDKSRRPEETLSEKVDQ